MEDATRVGEPLDKEGGVEAGGDGDGDEHERIADLGDGSENAGDVAEELETEGDGGELAGALATEVEDDLGETGQVEDGYGAHLQDDDD